ncbi:MAG: nuclear transport factor 2 family protein [Gammaproteobacteria bacterium]
MTYQKLLAGFAALLILTTIITGCSSSDKKLPGTVTGALAAAFTRGDVDGCVDVYTDDAEIIAPNAPVIRGKQAIKAFYMDQVTHDILFDTDSALSIVRDDLAVDQGTYRVRNVRLGKDVEYGEYLNIWRRANGQWRALRSMYTVTMAQQVGVSVGPEEDSSVAPTSPVPAHRR